MKQLDIEHWGQHLVLHPLKAVFWQEASTLLLADLHLGKVTHFRREGIPVPGAAREQNWQNLSALLDYFCPPRVIFLGDLFHSVHNAEWEQFLAFLQMYGSTRFELVRGNHDILPAAYYQEPLLTLHETTLAEAPFLLSHEPLADVPTGWYNLAGHLHPAVLLQGAGRQSLKLSCFYFGAQGGLLPAFGAFTGTALISPKSTDKIFVIAGDAVVKTSN